MIALAIGFLTGLAASAALLYFVKIVRDWLTSDLICDTPACAARTSGYGGQIKERPRSLDDPWLEDADWWKPSA